MKKIIYLLVLILLVGCTAKKDKAVVNNSPSPISTLKPSPISIPPLPSESPTPKPDPIIVAPPETLDDVDFSTYVLYFLCPQGVYYGYYEHLDEVPFSMTLELLNSNKQNNIRFVLEGTSGLFFVGIFNKIDKDFYSYYGYIYIPEERQEDYQGEINIVYDESFIRYFKYEDGFIYIFPDELTVEEMKKYSLEKNDGCKFVGKSPQY